MEQLHQDFARRLDEICDDKHLPDRGRQTILAQRFKVSQQAVRKWMKGEGYPSTDMARKIASWGKVNFEWLITGRGPKMLNSSYDDPDIEQVVTLMRAMEPAKRYLVARLAQTVTEHSKKK